MSDQNKAHERLSEPAGAGGVQALPNALPDTSTGPNKSLNEPTTPPPAVNLPVHRASAVTQTPTKMSLFRSYRWIWLSIGCLVLLGAGVVWWQPWVAKSPVVVVETLSLVPVQRILAVNGRVVGVVSVDLRFLIAGALVETLVVEGQIVPKGAVLARLDSGVAQATLRQALAGLDAALVAQSEAEAIWTRTKAMGANVARATLDTTARALTSSGQEVTQQKALLDQAQIALGKYTLHAPFAGTVLALAADPGQNVDVSSVLMTLADMGQLVVETDVDESYATQIRVGQVAMLQLTGETELLTGKVSFAAGQVNTETGGLAVKIAPDVALVAPLGLTVTVNITVDDRAAALTVARSALSGDAVMVLEGGQAKRRTVVVIPWPASRLIVTSGLATGDRVIVDPTGLTDGQSVTVMP